MNTDLLNALFENLPDAVYLIDPQSSNILYCNPRGYLDLGLNAAEVLNHSVLTLQKDVKGLPAWQEIAAEIRAKKFYTFMGRHRTQEGGEIPVEVNTSFFSFGGEDYFLSIARNITLRKLHEQDVLDRESKLWFALNEASDGLWDWNIADQSVYFSPQLKRMLGYGPDEMEPHVSTWENNIHPEDHPRVMRAINDHLHGKRERYQMEYRLKNRNGHFIWVRDRGKISDRDVDGQPLRMVGMAQNITDQKLTEFQLQEKASIDELTGILNRREGQMFFQQQLDLAHRLGYPLGVCLVDIDCFKQINDNHGHLLGDQVLKSVTEIVNTMIRKSDIFYRWGGDEFMLLFPDLKGENLYSMAESLRKAIKTHEWQPLLGNSSVTVSVGIAAFPENGTTAEDIMLNVDGNMYQAKAEGRNQVKGYAGSDPA